MTRELIREWTEDGFKLELYDLNRRRGNKWILGYRFFDGNNLIFEGEDFGCSPMHAIDSDKAVAALLSFLALRPGDTDREYFDSYTPAQMAWCQERGEYLGILAMELEESCK